MGKVIPTQSLFSQRGENSLRSLPHSLFNREFLALFGVVFVGPTTRGKWTRVIEFLEHCGSLSWCLIQVIGGVELWTPLLIWSKEFMVHD